MATWVAAPIATGAQQAAQPAILMPVIGVGFPVYNPHTQPPDGRLGWIPAPGAFSLVNNTVGVPL